MLATIVQVDPIYVTFNISERDVLRLRDVMAKRGMNRDDLMQVPVEVGLQSETGYPHTGHFDYAAPMLNSSTGTLAARAIFDNKDRALLPGYFVRVRIPVETRPTRCWCRTPRSAATRAAATCWSSTRTTWSSSARSRSVRDRRACA